MKLFAVYIGGQLKEANIELHDMRFVLAPSIEETYEELRRQWWGIAHTLHVDCWAELTQADSHRIVLKDYPSADSAKLYYVNLGGYDPSQFTEVHKNMFVVAETESKAKVRALKTVRHWDAFHKDDLYEAEQAFCLNREALARSWHIHLEKTNDDSPPPFICKYKNIGRPG